MFSVIRSSFEKALLWLKDCFVKNEDNGVSEAVSENSKKTAPLGEKTGKNRKKLLKNEGDHVVAKAKPPIVQNVQLYQDHIELQSKFLRKIEELNKIENTKPIAERNKIYLDEDQQKVVFSDNTSTKVLAGAGSGKSTALILRVIFLHFYLGVNTSEITVTTFTRNSRKDFIDKLCVRFGQWGVKLKEEDAEKIVRTFHSLAYYINKYLGNGKEILFDFDSDKLDLKKDPDGINISNLNEVVERKKDRISRKDKLQAQLFKNLYSKDTRFRKGVDELYIHYLKKIQDRRREQDVLPNMADEIEFSKKSFSIWQSRHSELKSIFLKYTGQGRSDHEYKPELIRC